MPFLIRNQHICVLVMGQTTKSGGRRKTFLISSVCDNAKKSEGICAEHTLRTRISHSASTAASRESLHLHLKSTQPVKDNALI
jgi:hypothetical protein